MKARSGESAHSKVTTVMRTIFCLAVLIVSSAVALPAAAPSDETLAHAKDLYASAAYDEALALLDTLRADAPADNRSIAEYRVFCLLALDRRDEARRNIEAMLHDNPQYVPSADQASPRIQSVFREVRKQSLPKIVIERYATAKASFERKDPKTTQQFDDVLALLDDPDVADAPALGDLRTVVAAFRDLTKAMAAVPKPEPPPARTAQPVVPVQLRETPTPTPAPQAQTSVPQSQEPIKSNLLIIYTAADQDVVPPVARAQSIPPWIPTRSDATQEFKGTLELLIDENGAVLSATMRESVHPTYNSVLLRAAREWKFAPARREGMAVRYLKVVDIHLKPSDARN